MVAVVLGGESSSKGGRGWGGEGKSYVTPTFLSAGTGSAGSPRRRVGSLASSAGAFFYKGEPGSQSDQMKKSVKKEVGKKENKTIVAGGGV